MIRKFVKIHCVGKFSDFSAHGEGLSLNRANIIYGENSTGKTTLTSIIKSLNRNEVGLITDRKTFGSEREQYCEILCEDNQKRQTCKFENNVWNGQMSETEIFDTYFVNENVYAGLAILSEHQKKLYQFALGEESVVLAQEIESTKQSLEKKHEQQRNTVKKLELISENVISPQDFVALPKDDEIDNKIAQKEREIKTAEAKQEITKKELLAPSSYLELSIDTAKLKALLQRSIEDISQEYLQVVEKHKHKLSSFMKEDTEQWLQLGISYIQETNDKDCPFCQQELKPVQDIIYAYNKYFDSRYKELRENINTYLEFVRYCSMEEKINQIINVVLKNNTLIEFWKTYLPKLADPKVELGQPSESIKMAFSDVKKTVESKAKNLLEKIDTESLSKFEQLLTELNSMLKNYNSQIETWNVEIELLKNKQPNLEELKNDLKRLKMQKKRYENEIDSLCSGYRSLWQDIEQCKKGIPEKETQLKELVSEKVGRYGNEINSHLEKFGVCFRIKEAKTIYKGRSKEPYLDYAIHMSDYFIDLENQLPYCMGEGDKNALAFAFFLAKLTLDEHIEDKIIVFDDPVSSLDRNRRRRSVEYVRELVRKAKQVIVLTHNDIFAFELYRSLRDMGIKPSTLQIYNGALEPWNIENAMKHRYFINISQLEGYIDGETTITTAEAKKLIRIVLEDALQFRYFKCFESLGDNRWLGPMIAKLREEVANNTVSFRNTDAQSVLNELNNLCDFSGPEHHGAIEQPHQEEISPTETKTYIESTLRLIFKWL